MASLPARRTHQTSSATQFGSIIVSTSATGISRTFKQLPQIGNYMRDIPKGASSIKDPWIQITQGVFKTQFFSKEQCSSNLLAIKNQSRTENVHAGHPNSMQDYGVVVEEAALNDEISLLANKQLKDTISRLFPSFPHQNFSHHHAFLTSYGEGGNQDLSLHIDASHLTLNICLESNAEGSDLIFTGARCRQHVNSAPDKDPVSVQFKPGDAVLHLGNQRHFVSPLISGSRHNLVAWYRLEKEPYDHNNPWLTRHCPVCQR
jgi:hypothetical protein